MALLATKRPLTNGCFNIPCHAFFQIACPGNEPESILRSI